MRSSKRSILNSVNIIPKNRSGLIRYPRDKGKIQTENFSIWPLLFMAGVITQREN